MLSDKVLVCPGCLGHASPHPLRPRVAAGIQGRPGPFVFFGNLVNQNRSDKSFTVDNNRELRNRTWLIEDG